MVDLQSSDVLHGLHKQCRPAEREGRVDLVFAVTGDRHVGVAWDADQYRPATADVQQHQRVRVLGPEVVADMQADYLLLGKPLPAVRTDDQPVLPRGLAGKGRKRDRPGQLGVHVEVRAHERHHQDHHDQTSNQGDPPPAAARLAPTTGSRSGRSWPPRPGQARTPPRWRLLGPCGPTAACSTGRYLTCPRLSGFRPVPAVLPITHFRHPYPPTPCLVVNTLGEVRSHSGRSSKLSRKMEVPVRGAAPPRKGPGASKSCTRTAGTTCTFTPAWPRRYTRLNDSYVIHAGRSALPGRHPAMRLILARREKAGQAGSSAAHRAGIPAPRTAWP